MGGMGESNRTFHHLAKEEEGREGNHVNQACFSRVSVGGGRSSKKKVICIPFPPLSRECFPFLLLLFPILATFSPCCHPLDTFLAAP